MLRSSNAFRLFVVLIIGITLGLVLGLAAVVVQNQLVSPKGLELTVTSIRHSNRQIETLLGMTQVGTSISITQTLAALTPTPQL